MVWNLHDPQGNEAAKIKYDVLRYCKQGIDIGCGPNKVWPNLIGIDSGIDTALFGIQMKPDIVVKDATRLPMFSNESMETVFSSHTLEHIQDYVTALREWWRLVKVGGYLILYLPHKDFYPNIGQPGANPDHKHDFIPKDIIDAMLLIGDDWSLVVNDERNQGMEYSFLQVFRKEQPGTGQQYPHKLPKPEKSVGIVRVGGHGDALWASSIVWHYKQRGYHITVYTAHTGAEVLRHDPNIDDIIVLLDGMLTDDELFAYWAYAATQHDKFINLIGSVETRLLAHGNEPGFYLPHKLRHKLMNVNYLEMVHDYADLPYDFRQKFYPTEQEKELAHKLRAELDGPLVVINPSGSGPTKYWPHTHMLMQQMANAGIYSIVLGDLQYGDIDNVEPFGHIVGKEWPVRLALAFAQLADVVVATESLIANAVAFESMLKVITLSHSSVENLTKHWKNTIAIEPTGISCYPCHRIHGRDLRFCSQDTTTGASACQAVATAPMIADIVIKYIKKQMAA